MKWHEMAKLMHCTGRKTRKTCDGPKVISFSKVRTTITFNPVQGANVGSVNCFFGKVGPSFWAGLCSVKSCYMRKMYLKQFCFVGGSSFRLDFLFLQAMCKCLFLVGDGCVNGISRFLDVWKLGA